jgi:hypothetical protein
MQHSRRLALILLVVAVPLLNLAAVIGWTQTPAKRSHLEPLPTVDYENPGESIDRVEKDIRRARGSHCDSSGPIHVEKLPPGIYPLPLNDHSWGGPGIPSQLSDVIVVGTVVHRQAYLTESKNQVYSEFSIQVEKQLKATDSSFLSAVITAQRWGGGVKMSDGRVLRYERVHARMPHLEKRYVFFLKYLKDGLDFDIVTAYEIKNGQIHPLDTFQQYEEYEGWTEDVFLRAISESVANEKGGY